MAVLKGGFLILFDESQRAEFLKEISELEDGFSDALSKHDWPLKKWEVCGLLLETDAITHFALARRRKTVVSGKVRVEFSHIVKAGIPLDAVIAKVGSKLRGHLISARAGSGGKFHRRHGRR